MAQLHSSYTYDSDVESVFALIRDPAFRTESCAAQGAEEYDVTVQDDTPAGGATVTIKRQQEADIPDFLKALVGRLAHVRQTEAWSAPDADGARSARITVDILGQPAGMKGSATLRQTPAGTEFTVEGEVKVAVPFLGRRLEPPIVDAILDSLNQDVALGTARL